MDRDLARAIEASLNVSQDDRDNEPSVIVIDSSDDEDDTHPNIHTPSLFKWRHEARVQRMQELEVEKERVSEGKKETEAALKRAKTAGHTTEDLEKQLKDWKLKVIHSL